MKKLLALLSIAFFLVTFSAQGVEANYRHHHGHAHYHCHGKGHHKVCHTHKHHSGHHKARYHR